MSCSVLTSPVALEGATRAKGVCKEASATSAALLFIKITFRIKRFTQRYSSRFAPRRTGPPGPRQSGLRLFLRKTLILPAALKRDSGPKGLGSFRRVSHGSAGSCSWKTLVSRTPLPEYVRISMNTPQKADAMVSVRASSARTLPRGGEERARRRTHWYSLWWMW